MDNKKISLLEIFKVFITIGTICFGGGLAIIAMIQEICVIQKKWLTLDEYSHGIALGQFMGPFAVNAAIFVGYSVRGFWGSIVALISFLAPSVSFVIILTNLYLQFNKIPSLQSALKGISPVVVALILHAAWQLSKGRIKNIEAYILIIISIILFAFIKMPVYLIIILGLIYGFIKASKSKESADENP